MLSTSNAGALISGAGPLTEGEDMGEDTTDIFMLETCCVGLEDGPTHVEAGELVTVPCDIARQLISLRRAKLLENVTEEDGVDGI